MTLMALREGLEYMKHTVAVLLGCHRALKQVGWLLWYGSDQGHSVAG